MLVCDCICARANTKHTNAFYVYMDVCRLSMYACMQSFYDCFVNNTFGILVIWWSFVLLAVVDI